MYAAVCCVHVCFADVYFRGGFSVTNGVDSMEEAEEGMSVAALAEAEGVGAPVAAKAGWAGEGAVMSCASFEDSVIVGVY